MADRAQLERWIANTQHNRRIVVRALGAALVLDVLVLVRDPRYGALGLALLAVVAVCSLWILASHLADWRGQLAKRAPLRANSHGSAHSANDANATATPTGT